MTAVKLEKGETSDRLIKRFIKRVKKAGILEEVFERRYYKKPSIRKKEEKARNIRNSKRKQREMEKQEDDPSPLEISLWKEVFKSKS